MLYPSFSDFMTAAIRRAEPTIGAHRALPMTLITIGKIIIKFFKQLTFNNYAYK